MGLRTAEIMTALLALILVQGTLSGCGPRPPIPYQTLQIQDSDESRGYDIYLYVAVDPKSLKPETKDAQIEALLKWFDEMKYPQVKRMRVFVWDNPQGALMNNSGDLVGTLNVDRANGVFELNVGNPRI
jgi:hypothetical protein